MYGRQNKTSRELRSAGRAKLKSAPLKNINDNKKSTANNQIVKTDENSSIGNLLTTAYGVIKLILEQLDWPDLMNASEVSYEWHKIANLIFAERQTPTWFNLIPNSKDRHDRHDIQTHRYAQYSKPALCFILINEVAQAPIPCKIMPVAACIETCKDEHRLLQYVEKLYAKSGCHIVALCSNSAASSFEEPVRVIKKLVLVPSMVGVVIPQINGVRINKFYITKKTVDKNLMKNMIGNDWEMKCLFTFFELENRSMADQTVVIERLMNVIHQHQPRVPFAYGGGIVQGTKDSDFDRHFYQTDRSILCITFSTHKNEKADFNAYSIILWDNAQDIEDIDIIISNLSKKAIRREHMAAFRFACISRSSLSEAEFDCFQKHFPDVHMIGFEGFGEMGLYNVPEDEIDSSESKRPCIDRDFTHSNTSIIVLLCWGKAV